MGRTNFTMAKTNYHFLAGLPRSGNTLLSALLNQHPSIYSSPLSPVPFLLYNNHQEVINSEMYARNEENQIRCKRVIENIIKTFYQDVQKPIIIDRDKAWGTPANLEIIKKYITDTPKIIFTVRDILEIIASFVAMDANYLKNDTANSGLYINNYRSPKDTVAEYLMRLNGDIDKALLSLASAFYPENKGIFYIVEYNDLILKPEETMSNIYKFLGLPDYKHDFNNIKKIEVDNDTVLGLPKDLHNVRESLSKLTTNTDILSDYIKHKYSNMEFWRDGSLMKIKGKDF
jgi:sulfotransferase